MPDPPLDSDRAGRATNEERLLRELESAPDGLTRSELGTRLGLSQTAISNVVSRLGKCLQEHPSANGKVRTPGPPPRVLSIAGDAGLAVGMDFTRSRCHVVLTTARGEVLAREKKAMRVAEEDQKALDWAAGRAQEMVEQHAQPDRVVAIGVSLAAPVDARLGMLEAGVQGVPVMRQWDGTRIKKELRQRLVDWTCPVYVDNDATLGCLAEMRYGAARGARHVAWISWSEGVGCGLALEGSIFRGLNGGAGEVGHLRVCLDEGETQARTCAHCEQECVESMAGAAALLRYAGIEDCDPTDIPERIAEIVASAGSNPKYEAALDKAARYLAQGLVAIVNLLNPERIVLGGAVPPSAYRYVNPGIQDVLHASAMTRLYREVEVVAGTRGLYEDAAALRGAAALALDNRLVPYLLDKAGLPARTVATVSD